MHVILLCTARRAISLRRRWSPASLFLVLTMKAITVFEKDSMLVVQSCSAVDF